MNYYRYLDRKCVLLHVYNSKKVTIFGYCPSDVHLTLKLFQVWVEPLFAIRNGQNNRGGRKILFDSIRLMGHFKQLYVNKMYGISIKVKLEQIEINYNFRSLGQNISAISNWKLNLVQQAETSPCDEMNLDKLEFKVW